MRIVVSRRAAEQVDAAYKFLVNENRSAARRQQEVLARAIAQLADFPEIGRPGRIDGSRELVIAGTPYIAAYRVRAGMIRVLAILHAARRWPTGF